MDQEQTDKQEEVPISEEQLDQETMRKDICPLCKTPTTSFIYLSGIPQLGWIECVFCGMVFCPKSVREEKVRRSASGIVKPKPNIIIP